MAGEKASECRYMIYVSTDETHGRAEELYMCTLFRDWNGGPGAGMCDACCLPSQGGPCKVPLGVEPEADPWLQKLRKDSLRACVRNAWAFTAAQMQPGWNHERIVQEAAALIGSEDVREQLNVAIVEGLDPVEAQRLKDRYAAVAVDPVEETPLDAIRP